MDRVKEREKYQEKYQKYQEKYQESDPELRRSSWSYMKLTDLTCVPKIRDIVAFKLMQLESRSNETRTGKQKKVTKLSPFKEGEQKKVTKLSPFKEGEQKKVTKLSPFKEGVVTMIDPKYKMVQVQLNEPFDIPG